MLSKGRIINKIWPFLTWEAPWRTNHRKASSSRASPLGDCAPWFTVYLCDWLGQGLLAQQLVAHLVEDVVERRLQNKARWMMTLLAEVGNLGCKNNDLDLPHILILILNFFGSSCTTNWGLISTRWEETAVPKLWPHTISWPLALESASCVILNHQPHPDEDGHKKRFLKRLPSRHPVVHSPCVPYHPGLSWSNLESNKYLCTRFNWWKITSW